VRSNAALYRTTTLRLYNQAMDDTRTNDARQQQKAQENGRLDSWKRIAAHFNRDVTTVQRWERRENMPVHRHVHDKQGSVYAFRPELDAWWENRRGQVPDAGDDGPVPVPSEQVLHALPHAPLEAAASEPAESEPAASEPAASEAAASEAAASEAAASEAAASEAAASEAAASEPAASEAAAQLDVSQNGLMPLVKRRVGVAAALAALLLLAYAVLRVAHPAGETWRNPFANATVTRLTDWPGIEQAAEISRDGRWATFLADRDGHMDAWLTQIGSGSYRNLIRGDRFELVNPAIRTLGFSADGSLVTIWTRGSDGSHPEDIKLLAAPITGGELRDFLPGVAEAAWSHDSRRIVYHTTAPGDPLFVRDAAGGTHRIYAAPPGVHCHFPVWSKDDAYIYFVRGTPPGNWDVWRILPSGEGLERITFHDSRVSHPVLLDEHTLVYLAGDAQGSGPWLYTLNLEQRVPHRISFGLERYTSLAASGGGTRLLATVAESHSSIWSVPLNPELGAGAGRPATQPASLISASGFAPRTGPGYILDVSTRAGRQGIWKTTEGQSLELWSDAHATIVGSPTVARDGRRIAFTVADGERTILYTMDSDGRDVRALTRALDLRGNPAWAPDGRSIVSAVLRDGEPRLMSIFLDDTPPAPLVSEYSIDPVWSPGGQFLIYSGADVGTTFPVRAVSSDGRPYPIPALILTRGARRVAFGRAADTLVLLRGEVGHKNFWLLDLRTGAEQQITDLAPGIAISDFDISRDGGAILFDRTEESSRIALIERRG
jgi:Tol biopolymer transport system component